MQPITKLNHTFRKILLLAGISCMAINSYSQTINFNTGIPENWRTNSTAPLSVSDQHFKDGMQSLKWVAKAGDVLKVTDLKIPISRMEAKSSGAQLFIYSTHISQDTLIFQFLDEKGVLKRQGHMLLNFKGWRDYNRNYLFDYNYRNDLPAFALDECRIIYKAQKKGNTTAIYFDAIKFIGDRNTNRLAAPHTLIDHRHFKISGTASGVPIESWMNKPDLPVTRATKEELKGLEKVRKIYRRTPAVASAKDVSLAKAYVKDAMISTNPDRSIKGRGIIAIHDPDTLVKLSKYVGVLASAYLSQQDHDARDQLITFTRYLIDQGLAEGGRNVLPTNTYHPTRAFPAGFRDALAIYPEDLRLEVMNMLKWSHEFNKIYAIKFTPGLNTDYIHIKLKTLLEIIAAETNDDLAVRDLKCLKRFLEQNTVIGEGGRDGIKPDGTGFHHHTHHMNYMYAFATWINHAYVLKGTVYSVDLAAYRNMSFAIKTLLLETLKGGIFPHALSGRKPFTSNAPVKADDIEKLIQIGGALINKPFEPELAAVYNYIYKTSKYPVKALNLDGFHQFNYAQLGISRKNNWMVAMRGFTDKSFGAEIYLDQNRYGRYQSYGTLEVLYDGQHQATGYITYGNGWDWNVMPGTTTVHLPWNTLRPSHPTTTEFQAGKFAGSLALGKNGIFGFDFIQQAKKRYLSSDLTFRKSVFAFDSIFVALGSHINTSNQQGPVATNLFQGIGKTENPPIYINSLKPVVADHQETIIPGKGGLWLLNGQTTGYYIPEGNGAVTIVRGTQNTPAYTANKQQVMHQALGSKAWINHGLQPLNAQYHFVAVPGITAERMKQLSTAFAEKPSYKVLSQTNHLHAVLYYPENLHAYVFFEAQENVNIGVVGSISAAALLAVENNNDELKVTIANPDLNTVADSLTMWKSTIRDINVGLKGHWQLAEDSDEARLSIDGDNTIISFALVHGFSKKVTLKRTAQSPKIEAIKIEGELYNVKSLYKEDFSDDTWQNKWAGEGLGAQFKVVNQKLHITDSIGATFWYLEELPANLIVRYKVCADGKYPENKINFNHFSHARKDKDAILVVGNESKRKGPYKEYHIFPNYIATFTPQHSRLRKDPGFNLLSNSTEKSVVDRVYQVMYTVKNGRLRYYLDGKIIHDVIDPAPLAGGKFGIRTWSSSAWWDDIEIGEILE